jgi:chromosome segregation and condensation protein ScpB
MTGRPVPSERLVEFIEARLGWLSAREREVLEVVAFADMVTAAELAAVSEVEAAEALEAAGVISVVPRDHRLELRVVSPPPVTCSSVHGHEHLSTQALR